jgi:hypothetical protein
MERDDLFKRYMEELDELHNTAKSIGDYAPMFGKVLKSKGSLGLGYTAALLVVIEDDAKRVLDRR